MKGWLNRLADFRWAPAIFLFLSFAACRSAPMQKTVDIEKEDLTLLKDEVAKDPYRWRYV